MLTFSFILTTAPVMSDMMRPPSMLAPDLSTNREICAGGASEAAIHRTEGQVLPKAERHSASKGV